MTIYTKQTQVAEFPAYNVYRREATRHGWVEITARDLLGLKMAHRSGDYYKTFQAGSVASYALEKNACPIAAVEDCKRKMAEFPYAGHRLHWINARSTMLTSHDRAAEDLIEVEIGMLVRFEGLVATIEADHNDNLKFVPVAPHA